MKSLLRNASVNLFLIAFPVLMVAACSHILTAIVLLATLSVVEMILLNHFSEYMKQKRARASGIYSFVGVALGLDFLSLNLPPQIAVIISLCLLIVGTVQIFLQDKILWVHIWQKWDSTGMFGLVEYVFFLAVALLSVLMVVANFNSQMIWLPLAACGLITYAYIRGCVLEFSAEDLDVKVIAGLILVVTGIVGTLIQFNEARIFGILIWVIALIIGIILVLVVTARYFQFVARGKRRTELEKVEAEELQEAEQKKKEMLQRSLLERTSELTWEEIFIGFNQINESLGIQLFLSYPRLGELSELVTVSNEKRQIFWNNDLSRMLQIMESAARKVQDDESLKKILYACASIKEVVETRKSEIGITYKGEPELKAKLDTIREMIQS